MKTREPAKRAKKPAEPKPDPVAPITGKKLKKVLEEIWSGGVLHPLHATMWVGDTDELGGKPVGFKTGLRHKKGKQLGKPKPRPPVFP
jgi:hypothetical protein